MFGEGSGKADSESEVLVQIDRGSNSSHTGRCKALDQGFATIRDII